MRQTSFRPTQEQEQALIDYLLARLPTLERDNQERIDADRDSWEAFNNDQKRRINIEGAFKDAEHNLALPLTSMIVESFISKAEDQITGADVYTKFKPQGPGVSDVDRAKDYDRFFQWKLETKAKTKSVLEDAYTAIFVQRAALFKAIWANQVSEWLDTTKNVLFEVRQGEDGQESAEPVKYLDPTGTPQLVIDGETPFLETQDATGQTVRALQDDPTIVENPAIHAWRPHPQGGILRSATIYKGPRASMVDYDAFLCPSNVRDLESADVVAEKYDKSMRDVEEMFFERSWLPWKNYHDEIQGESADAKTKTERNEKQERKAFDDQTHMVKLVEFWVRRDVLKWGRPQEFMVVVDVDNAKAVYYEFQAIVCPDLRRPFVCIAIGRQKNLWWGKSLPEKIKQYQQFADLQFAREAGRNELNANPIGVWHPEVVEGDPETLVVGGGLYQAKKAGTRAKDFVDYTEIPDLDTRTQAILEFVIYMCQLWLGVSNLSQGDYADAPENSTKYGIEASLREASKLGRRWIRRIMRGFQELHFKLVKLELANLDQQEVYTFMEGNVTQFATMTPELVANIEIDVDLVVQPEVRQQDIQAAQTALAVQERYFMAPPNIQLAMRPLMEKILNALAFTNVDELLPRPILPIDPLTGQPIVAPAAPAAAPGGGNFPGEQPGDTGETNQPAA